MRTGVVETGPCSCHEDENPIEASVLRIPELGRRATSTRSRAESTEVRNREAPRGGPCLGTREPTPEAVRVSFGEDRKLRFRPNEGRGFVDITAAHGSVIVIPYSTNESWKHEVPRTKRARGRRISLTLRAFD